VIPTRFHRGLRWATRGRCANAPTLSPHWLFGTPAAKGDSWSTPRKKRSATAELIADLRPRPAFYVRLLDSDHDAFRAVESFFREVVDPVVKEKGFRPDEIGMYPPEDAFMNIEIFRSLHYASLVVVDLTGVRPNCTMELGYALGRHRRCLLSAMKGTHRPFDSDKLPTYFWDPDSDRDAKLAQYGERFDLYSELPPLVK
jgi:hypothetical protein